MSEVRTKFTAEDSNIIGSLRSQAMLVRGVRTEIFRASRAYKKAGDERARFASKGTSAELMAQARGINAAVPALAKYAGGFFALTRVASSAASAVRATMNETRELSQAIGELTGKLSESELKLQIQGGLNSDQLNAQIPAIRKSLLQTPSTDLFGALAAQQQLISSGFNADDIESGAALSTVLDLKAATNQFGRDSSAADVAAGLKPVSQFLKAQGELAPGAGSIRRVGSKVARLFEGSEIQFEDLIPLAKEASTLTGFGIDEDTQLAAFSSLVDVKGGREGATGLRQVASRLRNAGDSSTKVRALEAIGLQPEDVDFVGEDFATALTRMRDALQGVDEATASIVKTKIFGEEGAGSASVLLGALDQVAERRALLPAAEDTLDRNTGLFRGSRFAANQRATIREQFAQRQIDRDAGQITFAEIDQELSALFAESVANAGTRGERVSLAAQKAAITELLSLDEGLASNPLGAAGAIFTLSQDLTGLLDNRLARDLTLKLNQRQRAIAGTPQQREIAQRNLQQGQQLGFAPAVVAPQPLTGDRVPSAAAAVDSDNAGGDIAGKLNQLIGEVIRQTQVVQLQSGQASDSRVSATAAAGLSVHKEPGG